MRSDLAQILLCTIFRGNTEARKESAAKPGSKAGVAAGAQPAPEVTSGIKKIKHVIWTIQENQRSTQD